MKTPPPPFRWIVVMAMLALAGPAALAQVEAPDGNDLPGEQGSISTHALKTPGGPEPSTMVESEPRAGATGGRADPHRTISSDLPRGKHAAFADRVNLSQFRELAVFAGGRVKTIGTLAREHLNRIYGKNAWEDPVSGRSYDPVFTYLDLLLNARYYFDKPIIQVEVLPLRRKLLAGLNLTEKQRHKWLRRGRLTLNMFAAPRVQRVMRGEGGGVGPNAMLIMQARDEVMNALMAFQNTGGQLNMVSPPEGSDQWASLFSLGDTRLAAADARAVPLPETVVARPKLGREAAGALDRLASAWHDLDAGGVNQSLADLNHLLPRLNPSTYPPRYRLTLEHFYNATHKFTIGYIAYALGALTLLLAFAVNRKWVIGLGAALLIGGFLWHGAGMATRGILAGRWPIHNQFESFFAVTWFAVGVGLVLMLLRRQWLFGAAAAALGAASLLLANLSNIPSNNISQVAGILATSNILYVHVNMVLASYALIGLGFVLSLFYLAFYYFSGPGGSGGAGGGGSGPGDHGVLQFAAVGLGDVPAGESPAAVPGRQKLLADLDKAQIIVLQFAFWLLGTSVLLGAYWANHSWGRWWGWDPKETWALITWIVYLIAIHVRLGVTRRGLVTAWLSVLGFGVMCWTYWGVNLLLAGLHSYA